MEIDLPEVVAEVKAAFEGYEKALVANHVARSTRCFTTIPAPSAMAARKIFTVMPRSAPFARTLSKTVISTYGRDFAVASTLFHRAGTPGKVGRQMQTWVRFPQGWRVVAAHVSAIDDK
jgi:hypothetical protein